MNKVYVNDYESKTKIWNDEEDDDYSTEEIDDDEFETIDADDDELKKFSIVVYPLSQTDFNVFLEWLDSSSYYAEEQKDGSFIFTEDEDLIESLEIELEQVILDLGISAKIEPQN